MKNAKPKLDKLEQKYKGKTDQESMMKKLYEGYELYCTPHTFLPH